MADVLAGQIGDPATPTAGAGLYLLSRDSYGRQVVSISGAADSPLQIETPDEPVLEDISRTILRRIFLVGRIQFAPATFRVTPIVDFTQYLASVQFTLQTPTNPLGDLWERQFSVHRTCTWCRLLIEIVRPTSGTIPPMGRIEFSRWNMGHKPIARVAVLAGQQSA